MSDTKFIVKGGDLYLEFEGFPAKKVLRGFESVTGWYHFATEIPRVDVRRANGKEETLDFPEGNVEMPKLNAGDKVIDIIYFGYVQGFEEEWGYFALSELQEVMRMGKEWEIPKANLPHSGRRH